MNFVTKVGRAAADLALVNATYLADGSHRSQLREVLRRNGVRALERGAHRAEFLAASEVARSYVGLAQTSLALAGIRSDATLSPALNLLVGEVRPRGIFAGVHTAVTVAARLSARLSVPLRVVMLDFTSPGNSETAVRDHLARTFGLENVEVLARDRLANHSFGSRDVWLATHSKTAHAAQVATIGGRIEAERVGYLIQDYEPGFSPWSTESAIAASTYHAGFVPIVNSLPLWSYLTSVEGLDIPQADAFAPTFELERLRSAAERRVTDGPMRVLFYGRPSKHRNLFDLGISALRAAVSELGSEAADTRFFSVGESHDHLELGAGVPLVQLGHLDWDAYFDELARTSVLLSLQASPHPSHPPFDAAISGAVAITNDFASTRTGLHPRLTAVRADTASLAGAIVAAVRTRPSDRSYLEVRDGLLGQPLDDVLTSVLERLRTG